MTEDEIIEALDSDKEVVVDNIWSFRGLSMVCCDGCCDDSYSTVQEAARAALFYSDGDNIEIEVD